MPGYVKYDVKLPSRNLLKVMIGTGCLMIVAGVAALIASAVGLLSESGYSNKDYYNELGYCDSYESFYRPVAEVSDRFYDCSPEPVSMFSTEWFVQHWYYGLILLAVGIIVAAYVQIRFNEYFRTVSQGKILRLDTSGGGRDYPLRWMVLIEGYTLSNELRRDWREVNAGYWRDADVDDWVTLTR